jgi:beta-galactosidase
MIDSVPVTVTGGFTRAAPAVPAIALPTDQPAIIADATPETAEPASLGQFGRFVTNFSYTGSVATVHIEAGAEDGKNIYVDRDTAFVGLPAELRGADWVQAGQADSLYSALDFIQIAVPAGVTVYVAHDDRLPLPSWLLGQFEKSGLRIVVAGQPMAVFAHRALRDESLTLGSNSEKTAGGQPNMYVVFAKRPE